MTDDEMAQLEAGAKGTGHLTDEQMADLEDPELAFLQKGHKRQPERPFAHHETADELRAMLGPRVHDSTPAGRFGNAEATAKDVAQGTSGALNSGMDRFTLGAWGALHRMAGHIPGPLGEPSREAVADMERYRAAVPAVSAVSDLPAYMIDGPVTALTTAVAKPVSRAVDFATKRGIGPLQARLAATIGTGAGVGGAASGLEALSEGQDPESILRRTGEGATTGALVSGGLGLGASLLSPAADAVLGSKGAQARRFLEERGGSVSPGKVELPPGEYAATGASDADIGAQGEASAGTILDALRKKLPPGTSPGELRAAAQAVADDLAGRRARLASDTTAQAQESARRGLSMLNEEKKGVLRGVGSKIGRIEQSPEAATLHDVSDVVTNMRQAIHELDTSPNAKAALQGMIDDVTAKQGADFNPDTDGYMLSESDVNKMRRELDRVAKTGGSTDASLGPLKSAANQVRSLTQEGPFAEANAEYAKESKHYQKSRRLLGVSERPKTPEETRTAEAAVARRLENRGRASATEGRYAADLAEFEARHPDIAAEFDRPTRMRRQGETAIEAYRLAEEQRLADLRGQRQQFAEDSLYPLGLKDLAEGDTTPAELSKVKNLLIRRGQNTVTGGGQSGASSVFQERHPELALEFDKPELLRKRADISFGIMPKHGGLLDRMTHGHYNLAAALGLSAGGLTGAVPALTLRNLPAIQARLLAPAAEELKLAEPFLLNAIPTYAAARAAHGEE